MIGLGIDTGGTCTDAVLYDLDRQHVLSRGETPTTKACLETGIARAIQKLDSATLQKIAFVSLSTTLATNACVENRGAAVKLLFIGVDEATVREQYQKYGFTCMDDLIFIDGIPPGGFCKPKAPDWDALEHQLDAFKGAEAIGIVQYFPEWNQGAYEKKARDILSQKTDVPIVCGSELFSDLNAIRRGAGTYLNVRLIPIIQSFLTAVKKVLNAMALPVPLYIVRSDGSLMSEAFAQSHPVETLLSGPAASATGGAWMSEAQNAIVVDIGGTTTDIALIQDGLPVTLKEGITINGWKTFVKGLFIDTFGLGGD
ncbi:MAG: hydantoinase/oxoprolinase family protein, partial [Eubacteriaceae bacterium]|nr:hydantoinase/oxoprolinase family protein [Eubacteriaceae bacterium]